jgi:hypothetical protein
VAAVSRIGFSYDCCRPNSGLIRASRVKDTQTELHGRSRQRDVHRTQAALGLFDVECDGLALVEQADIRGQVGAVDENVPAIIIAREKAVALGFIKEFDFACDGHLLTLCCSDGISCCSVEPWPAALRQPIVHVSRRLRRFRVKWIATRLCWSQSRDGFCKMCGKQERGGRSFARPACARGNAAKTTLLSRAGVAILFANASYHLDRATKIFFDLF